MKIKKIIGKIISVSLIVVAVYSAVPVFGASVGIAWSGYANKSVAIIKTGTSYKINATPVRLWYIEGNSNLLKCTVSADNGNGDYVDVTYYGTSSHPYYAPKNAGYAAISNTAYEKYGNCRVKVYMETAQAGNHSGKWMPAIE